MEGGGKGRDGRIMRGKAGGLRGRNCMRGRNCDSILEIGQRKYTFSEK